MGTVMITASGYTFCPIAWYWTFYPFWSRDSKNQFISIVTSYACLATFFIAGQWRKQSKQAQGVDNIQKFFIEVSQILNILNMHLILFLQVYAIRPYRELKLNKNKIKTDVFMSGHTIPLHSTDDMSEENFHLSHEMVDASKTNLQETFSSWVNDGQNIEEIQCSVCEEKYQSITEYTHHLNTHLEICEQSIDVNSKTCAELALPCKAGFKSESLAQPDTNDSNGDSCFKIKEEIPPEPYNVTVLKSNALSEAPSLKDEKADHKAERLSCTLCYKLFSTKSSLKKHVAVIHDKLKPFSCTLCDKSFAQKAKLTQHVDAVHYKLKPFPCTLCYKSFAYKEQMSNHIEEVHYKIKRRDKELNVFLCTFCDKSFSKKRDMIGHIDAEHHKMELFSCSWCDQSFALKQSLTTHVKTVHPKPFSCTLCEKSFSGNHSLKRHLDSVHYKLKSFPCTKCNKLFSTKSILIKHADTVHNKIKLFSCTLCQKSFSQKTYLTQGRRYRVHEYTIVSPWDPKGKANLCSCIAYRTGNQPQIVSIMAFGFDLRSYSLIHVMSIVFLGGQASVTICHFAKVLMPSDMT